MLIFVCNNEIRSFEYIEKFAKEYENYLQNKQCILVYYTRVLNLEIVEHVDNLDLYLQSCKNLLKKDGLMFTATINRTLMSYIKAILGAEYILRWLPIGTHDWNKFIKPEELQKKLDEKNFSTSDIKGLEFNPILRKWRKSNNLSVNYIISSIKN